MADVASDLKSWSTTASSNLPIGSTAVGTGLDDNLREIQKVVRQDLATKGADIASATTTDLGAVPGSMHDITGTTTITGFGTVSAGIAKVLKFEGVLTLTHNATSLILPGAADITTADGDTGYFISEGSGNWRCIHWQPAATAPIAATQTEMEAATSTTRVVTPAKVQNHPGVCKGWAHATIAGGVLTSQASHNCVLTRTGTAAFLATWGTDFSSANYAWGVNHDGDRSVVKSGSITQAAGSVAFTLERTNDQTQQDPAKIYVWAFGDQ